MITRTIEDQNDFFSKNNDNNAYFQYDDIIIVLSKDLDSKIKIYWNGFDADCEVEKYYQNLPTDKTLIFADAIGLKSRESVLFMEAQGYENVVNMAGGIVDWERDGLPLSTDINNRLSGSCMCQLKAREGVRSRRNERGNG